MPLALIRDGAGLVRNADDLLLDLGRLDLAAMPPAVAGDGGPGPGLPASLTTLERRVAEALATPTLPGSLADALGCSLADVLTAIIGLEVRGLVRSVGGRVERRIGASAR